MMAEQGLHWISRECLYFSTALSESISRWPQEEEESCQHPMHAVGGQQLSGTQLPASPKPPRKEGWKSWRKPAFTWGTRDTSPWFCWKPESRVSFFPLLGCISTPAKTTALQCHPSCLLRFRMLMPSSPPHGARTCLYHHIPPPSLPLPIHTPTRT